MNQVNLVGRIGQDPETRQAGENNVHTFSIATNEGYMKNGEWHEATEWHNCERWSDSINVVKGDLVSVVGSIKTDKYEDKDGKTQYRTKIRVRSMRRLNKRDIASALIQAKGAPKTVNDTDDMPF